MSESESDWPSEDPHGRAELMQTWNNDPSRTTTTTTTEHDLPEKATDADTTTTPKHHRVPPRQPHAPDACLGSLAHLLISFILVGLHGDQNKTPSNAGDEGILEVELEFEVPGHGVSLVQDIRSECVGGPPPHMMSAGVRSPSWVELALPAVDSI